MTLLDKEHEVERPGDVAVLIPEARRFQRRRNAWVAVGSVLVAIVVALAVVVLVARAGAGSTAPGAPRGAALTVPLARQVNLRPVVCDAPPARPGASATALTAGSCTPPYQLSAVNLAVAPAPGQRAGYAVNSIGPEPALGAVASTPPSRIAPDRPVLLGGTGAGRYLLDPTVLRLSPTIVSHAAVAQAPTGYWVVDVTLTAAGSAQEDAVMRAYFHEQLAVVVDGRVVAAPLIQPAQAAFTSLGGSLVLSGSFTQSAARSIASVL